MPPLEVHCKECKEKLGDEFRQVHIWLDEFAPDYERNKQHMHRLVRHHTRGVAEVKSLFGELAVKAAELHIMTDYKIDHVPTQAEAFAKFHSYNSQAE